MSLPAKPVSFPLSKVVTIASSAPAGIAHLHDNKPKGYHTDQLYTVQCDKNEYEKSINVVYNEPPDWQDQQIGWLDTMENAKKNSTKI